MKRLMPIMDLPKKLCHIRILFPIKADQLDAKPVFHRPPKRYR